MAVPFSRWCVPKPMITKTSVSDCREFFGGFLVKVKQGAEELAASGRAAGASPFAAAAGGVDAGGCAGEAVQRVTGATGAMLEAQGVWGWLQLWWAHSHVPLVFKRAC